MLIDSGIFAQKPEKGDVHIVKVTVVVAERIKAIKDSLTRSGVDSIIIYSKACNECLTERGFFTVPRVGRG